MPIINYYTGQRTIKVEVSEKMADGYRQMLRDEWRSEKRWKRNVAPISLSQMEDESGYQPEDLSTEDPLECMIRREWRKEFRVCLAKAIHTLTPRQLVLIERLKIGENISQIAAEFGVSKAAVSEMRARIQEKIKNFTHKQHIL